MLKEKARQRIEKLKKVIDYHRYLYHVLDKQEISENALDSLKKELFDLEQKYPEFITSDSSTQRVAGKPLEKFEKVKHFLPMLSLNDAFSEKDMKDWLIRISKLLTKEEQREIDFFSELKIDGLAVELIYKNGIFEIGSTRGDGLIGENVTQNLKTIESIPLKIEDKNQKIENKTIIVRGEVFVSKTEFEKTNKYQEKKGFSVFANPRNMAAGSIRQLNSKITAQRKLDFFAYDLITDLGQKSHEEKHKILKSLGFKINPYDKYCKELKDVFQFHKFCQTNREKIDYEVDGIVVIVNSNAIYEKLGVVGKASRASVAYKFPSKEATTIVEDIFVQVGRTGSLTPVAILKSVDLGGVKITRATLHNEDEIKKLGIKIGDTVIVGRAGDVIPNIIRVIPELRTGKEKEFEFPKKCPSCEGNVIKKQGEVAWRCINSKCFARQREYFYHFASKKGFNIVGLGPKIIDKLLDIGLVSDPADLFNLNVGDIICMDSLKNKKLKSFLFGFAEKSAQNLISAIQSKKEINLARFIYALGIRNVGEQTAYDLAESFSATSKLGWDFLENLKKADLEDFEKIMDIGPIVADSIFNYFRNIKNLDFLEKLKKSEIIIENQKLKIENKKLKGIIFVLTGSLEFMTRNEAEEKIKEQGGKVSSLVSVNTNYVIAGKDPGSKIKKAEILGVKILSEKEFLKLIT